MVALATLPVVALGLLVPRLASVPPVDKLSWLTPQLAPLFAFGLAGAGMVRHAGPGSAGCLALARRARRRAGARRLMISAGTVWTVQHYFWIDLALGPALVLLLVAVSTGRPAALVRVLDTGPVKGLSRFSYSLYLVHLPIVVAVNRTLTGHHASRAGCRFSWPRWWWRCRCRSGSRSCSPGCSRSRSSVTAAGRTRR